MKKILLSLFTLFLAFNVFAQNQNPSALNQTQTVEKYRTMFKLNEEQGREMEKIVARRVRNLGEIQKFKTENPAKFLKKRKSIDMGMNNSIRMILNAEQLKVYREQQIELRRKRAYKENEMRKNNASQKEIDETMAGMYLI